MQSESGTHKISDSGYSNSCSNSQSQRSGTSGTSGSSKSRNSGSNSSRSSGYCGGSRHQCVSTDSSNEVNPKPLLKRNKEKDHKKKKLKVDGITTIPALTEIETATDIPNCSTVADKTLNEKEDETTDIGQENVESNHPTVIEGAQDIQVSLKSPQLSTLVAEATETEPKGVQTWATSSAGILPPEEQGIPKNAEAEKEETESPSTPHVPEQLTPKKRVNDSEDGFYCVISMHDGVVLYTTPTLTTILGFPQDMWLGRSFIDFVHPKDRVTFASHITTDVAIPIAETSGQVKECRQNSLYVSLRKYRGLKSSGFGVVEKAVTYMPFHLSLIFRQMQPKSSSLMSTNSNSNPDYKSLYLIVSASPLQSPYKVPDETYVSTRFCTRHTTTCEISHVDPDVVTNFGFFPQDMLRHSIFDFYHPEDMLFLKKVYQTVVEKAQITGSVFRSKPYRFATQNGTYATIETDWSCFVNPWTRKVEFIVGHHRVLQGPRNPNIFESTREDSSQISEEVLKESKLIQAEIQYLLLSELPRPGNIARQQVSQRCKDLASFMETLMEDVTRSNHIQLDVPHEIDPSFSERDSVMLGEISPHHDYYDSKSSSETPPSYNQLNYNENLQRFFESKPMTKAEDDNIEQKSTSINLQMEVESKNNVNPPTCLNRKHLSPIQTSGDSGSGSADNSSGSNPNMDGSGNTSGTNASNSGSYKPPTLTEELLVRHNEDMEKEMAKRHKERRSGNKADRDAHKNSKTYHKMCFQSPMDKNDPQGHGHGLKRSGSHSWEGDYHKQSKHQHTDQVDFLNHPREHNHEAASIIPSVLNPTVLESNVNNSTMMPNETYLQSTINNTNLWPPFSVSASPMQNSNQCITTSAFAGNVMPVYYIVQSGQPPQEHPGPPPYSLSCFPNMVFPSVAFPTPIMYPSLALLHPLSLPVKTPTQLIRPAAPNVSTNSKTSMSLTTHTHEHRTVCTTSNENNKTHKPASQATSIKAELGSAMESVASNSVTNKALSEYSKRELGVHSLCSIGSLQASSPDQDGLEKTNTSLPSQLDERERVDTKGNQSGGSLECDGESSYSSFYSSFLKTEASVSNDENTNSDNKGNSTSKSEECKNRKSQGIKRKTIPPWLEAVTVTPELVYQYQLSFKNMSDILQADLLSLKEINQPMLVNDQLSQLYLDLELEGLSSKLTLEDGLTSSSSSGEETSSGKKKASRKRRSYSKMVIIYEEDAPFPPAPQ